MVQIVVLWPLLFLCLFLHLYLQDLDFIFINKGKFVYFNCKYFPNLYSCSFYYPTSNCNFYFILDCGNICVPNVATFCVSLIFPACLFTKIYTRRRYMFTKRTCFCSQKIMKLVCYICDVSNIGLIHVISLSVFIMSITTSWRGALY